MRGFLKVSTIYSSINMVIKIGAIAFAVYAAQNNLVSVASVYLIITYTGSVAHELWNMNGIMRNYNRIIGNANDMVEILQTPTTLIDKSDSKLKVTNGEISMDKIIFTHDEVKATPYSTTFLWILNQAKNRFGWSERFRKNDAH